MKRLFCLTLATGFFALSSPADSSAQTSIFVGGGATFPVGSLTDVGGFVGANVGWQGTAGAQFTVGPSGLTLGPRVYYGSNNHSNGNKTNLFGATALVNYGFRDPEVVNPFVWGEFGLMSYSFKSESTPASDATDTGGVLAGGAGVGIPLGGVNAWVAAGYTQDLGLTNATTYFGLYAGVSFALGGG